MLSELYMIAMGTEEARFGGLVVAAFAVIAGTAYFMQATLAWLDSGASATYLLGGSPVVSMSIGVLLLLTAGFLIVGSAFGRYLGVLSFGAIAVFGRPSLVNPEPAILIQAGLAFAIAFALVFINPVKNEAAHKVDESGSATKMGSTIR
jgi:hypothetical protein